MTRIDDLEAALAAAWDREQLAVYGDALQAAGDPRGEMIAIDLHDDVHGMSPRLEHRRRQLMSAWLGAVWPSSAIRCRYGFVELELDGRRNLANVDQLLGGDAAAFLRVVRVAGAPRFLAEIVDDLAAAIRPWLTRLELRQRGTPDGTRGGTSVSREAGARLAAMTPRLDELSVHGGRVFAAFAHPTVRRLRITAWDAIESLAAAGEPWSGVEELDFAFHRTALDDHAYATDHAQPPTDHARARLLGAAWLPALRRLDLSRNEPGFGEPDRLGGSIDVFGFVDQLAVAAQLTHLRLPSLRSAADRDRLQAALDRMPHLVECEVVRAYTAYVAPALHHPTARIAVAPPRPWPPLDTVANELISIQVAGEPAVRIALARVVDLMEATYAAFPDDIQAAWTDWWRQIGGLRHTRDATTMVLIDPIERGLLAAAAQTAPQRPARTATAVHRWDVLAP